MLGLGAFPPRVVVSESHRIAWRWMAIVGLFRYSVYPMIPNSGDFKFIYMFAA